MSPVEKGRGNCIHNQRGKEPSRTHQTMLPLHPSSPQAQVCMPLVEGCHPPRQHCREKDPLVDYVPATTLNRHQVFPSAKGNGGRWTLQGRRSFHVTTSASGCQAALSDPTLHITQRMLRSQVLGQTGFMHNQLRALCQVDGCEDPRE